MRQRIRKGSLRELREAKGLTQDQLATMSGVTQGTVSAIERTESNPSSSTAMALAKALGMGVQEFLDYCFSADAEVA